MFNCIKCNKEIKHKGNLVIHEKYCKTNLCLYCNKNIPNHKKYCDNKCQHEYKLQIEIEKWLNGETSGNSKSGHNGYVRRYLLKIHNNKCSKCGWCEINKYNGRLPLEVEHIDGNAYNNRPDNVDLLCPNCQSLTKTYRGSNRGNGRRTYLKKYYIKGSDGKVI